MTRCLFLLALLISALSLSCRQDTEEQRILGLFDNLARLAEKKELEGMMTAFADDYSDFEGRNKAGLRNLLSGYFSGRTGIVVNRLSAEVELEAGQSRATLKADIALSSGAAEALRRLVRVSPDLYRLNIELSGGPGSWLIRYAEWTPISPTELLPESLSLFKKLSPKS
ncbi:MAG: hypothetical protein QHH14_04900 [Clostridiales bacterium]|nr:hypothetical protein [Clostridiales bacterium]